jgi:transcription-repair coupling factor (superfamily II helicase)
MYEQKQNSYELRILYQDMIDKIGRMPQFLNKLCEINTIRDYQEDQALFYCKQAIAKDPNLKTKLSAEASSYSLAVGLAMWQP